MVKSIKLAAGPVPVAYTPWAVGEMFEELGYTFANLSEKIGAATYKDQCKMAYWGLAGGYVAANKKEYSKGYFEAINEHIATQEHLNAVIEVLLEQFGIVDAEDAPKEDGEGK